MALKDRFKKFKTEIQPPKEEADAEIIEIVETPEVPEEPIVVKDDIKPLILKELYKKVETVPVWNDYPLEKRKELISVFLNTKLENEFKGVKFTQIDREILINNFLNSVYGFGELDLILAEENTIAVILNDNKSVYIQKEAGLEKSDLQVNKSVLEKILKRFKSEQNVQIFQGENFNVTYIQGKIIIRKKLPVLTGKNLVDEGFISEEAMNKLFDLINEKKRVLIAGKMNSGKTKLLSALLHYIDIRNTVALFEDYKQINIETVNLFKFELNGLKDQIDYERLISQVLKLNPSYFVLDVSLADFLTDFTSNVSVGGVISVFTSGTFDGAKSFASSVGFDAVVFVECTSGVLEVLG